MHAADILADAFGRIRVVAHHAGDGLSAEGLAFRPESEANSIAWLLWHLTRIQDDHVAEIAGREQEWITGEWPTRLAMAADPADTGYGHTAEQVAAVRPSDPEALLGYLDAVSDRTLAYLAAAEPEDLDRIIDRSYDPPVSVGVRLVSVISDDLQHAGQASYVRGIFDRRGRAGLA